MSAKDFIQNDCHISASYCRELAFGIYHLCGMGYETHSLTTPNMTSSIVIINDGASSEFTRRGYEPNLSGISKWLVSKNIIEQREMLVRYTDLTPWGRAGGETYYADFEITTDSKVSRIVIKSLVTLFPERSLRDWSRRRNILAVNDVPVSKWYWFGEATVFEDFYEFTAAEKVKFETLLVIGFKLDSLGFNTFNFINDMRADSYGNPHYVDFGLDLGEPSDEKTVSARKCLCKMFPERSLEIEQFYAQRV